MWSILSHPPVRLSLPAPGLARQPHPRFRSRLCLPAATGARPQGRPPQQVAAAGAKLAMRWHHSVLQSPLAAFLRDCSWFFSLFMNSAPSRLKTGSIPASPSATAQPCLSPFYKQVGATSVVAPPLRSCSIPLNVSGARFEPSQALLGSSAGGSEPCGHS